MHDLMQIALMRKVITDLSEQRKIDDMLVHQGARATCAYVRPIWAGIALEK